MHVKLNLLVLRNTTSYLISLALQGWSYPEDEHQRLRRQEKAKKDSI